MEIKTHNCLENLGDKVMCRDDQTVQLKCLICGNIHSVDSRDFDEVMQREAENDLDPMGLYEPDEYEED